MNIIHYNSKVIIYDDSNRQWADRIINTVDPAYQYRWQVYNQHVSMLLFPEKIWLDIGCGDDAVIQVLGHKVRMAIGIDRELLTERSNTQFICADIYHLPFRRNCVDVITLRFVIEHIQYISKALAEITNVLKPNGKVALITTNTWCPFIFFSRILPFSIKKYLINKLYRISLQDIQETFHKFNSPNTVTKGACSLQLTFFQCIQDINYTNRFLFFVTLIWHTITKIFSIESLRSCILAEYTKKESEICSNQAASA